MFTHIMTRTQIHILTWTLVNSHRRWHAPTHWLTLTYLYTYIYKLIIPYSCTYTHTQVCRLTHLYTYLYPTYSQIHIRTLTHTPPRDIEITPFTHRVVSTSLSGPRGTLHPTPPVHGGPSLMIQGCVPFKWTSPGRGPNAGTPGTGGRGSGEDPQSRLEGPCAEDRPRDRKRVSTSSVLRGGVETCVQT